MQINSYNYINFGANLNSPKLKFKREDFFIKIRGYGKNIDWADEVINISDTSVNLFRNDCNPEYVLKYIAVKSKDAAKLTTDLTKKKLTGYLRTKRENWIYSPIDYSNLYTPYNESSRYKCYAQKFNQTLRKPLSNPLSYGLDLTRPDGNCLIHAPVNKLNHSLEMVFNRTKRIIPKYVKEEITEEDLPSVIKRIAEIRWILAHSTPFKRGSDLISNIYIRAICKAVGIKLSPLKKGVSLDLEAYCTDLFNYKNNFSSYFEKKPFIVD